MVKWVLFSAPLFLVAWFILKNDVVGNDEAGVYRYPNGTMDPQELPPGTVITRGLSKTNVARYYVGTSQASARLEWTLANGLLVQRGTFTVDYRLNPNRVAELRSRGGEGIVSKYGGRYRLADEFVAVKLQGQVTDNAQTLGKMIDQGGSGLSARMQGMVAALGDELNSEDTWFVLGKSRIKWQNLTFEVGAPVQAEVPLEVAVPDDAVLPHVASHSSENTWKESPRILTVGLAREVANASIVMAGLVAFLFTLTQVKILTGKEARRAKASRERTRERKKEELEYRSLSEADALERMARSPWDRSDQTPLVMSSGADLREMINDVRTGRNADYDS